MPPQAKDKLSDQARTQCEEAMKDLIEGDLTVDPGNSRLEWNSVLRRHVFEQTFLVWRDFDEIEVVVSPEGEIVSFRDPGRFIKDDSVEVPELFVTSIMRAAQTSGLLGPSPTIVKSYAGAKKMAMADIAQVEPDLPAAITFTINPLTQQLAAYRVTRRD